MRCPSAIGFVLAVMSAWAQQQQPIPFSHRQHATAAALQCVECHAGSTTQDQAGMPASAKCMACHRTIKADVEPIRKLAALHEKNAKVPWIRLYKVPDFVFFSHVNHIKAKVACSSCHGAVETRDVLTKEIGSTNMAACLECHRERKAPVDCSACHQLGQ